MCEALRIRQRIRYCFRNQKPVSQRINTSLIDVGPHLAFPPFALQAKSIDWSVALIRRKQTDAVTTPKDYTGTESRQRLKVEELAKKNFARTYM